MPKDEICFSNKEIDRFKDHGMICMTVLVRSVMEPAIRIKIFFKKSLHFCSLFNNIHLISHFKDNAIYFSINVRQNFHLLNYQKNDFSYIMQYFRLFMPFS